MHKFNINNQRLQSKLHLQLVDRPLVLLHLLLYPANTKNAKTTHSSKNSDKITSSPSPL